jgi:hypothetical protein
MTDTLQNYLVFYVLASALISGLYCYYQGPVTNIRALNILDWFLKFIGLAMTVKAVQYTMAKEWLTLVFIVWITNRLNSLPIGIGSLFKNKIKSIPVIGQIK